MNPFDFLDLKSFWSIWYWLMTVVAWSLTSHWTLGVPFDLIVLADKEEDRFAEQCDILAQINVDRIIYYFDKGGIFFVGFAAFFLSTIGTMGFFLGSELFAALFMLIAPLMIVGGFTVKFAYRVRNEGWVGDELRRRLRWRRLWNQVIGIFAITAASVIATLYFLISTGFFQQI